MDDLLRADERLLAARDSLYQDLDGQIAQLRQEHDNILERLDALNSKKAKTAEEHGDVDAAGDDLIEINAGGETIAAKRSTLTQLSGSRLEAIFSGRWDQRLQRDRYGRIFLDVNPVCFRAIVDFLHELAISSGDHRPNPPCVDNYNERSLILQHQLALFGLQDKCDKISGRNYDNSRLEAASKVEDINRFTTDVNRAIKEKRTALILAEDQMQHLEECFKDENKFISAFALGETKDIVLVNVSGTEMATKRSTLQIVEDSVLAQQFDDTKWTEQNTVKKWTPSDVYNWVQGIGGISEDVADIFRENEINGPELLSLGIGGLKDMGIKRAGTVHLLLNEMKKIQGITLIEHSPYCFGKIVDYLRWKHAQSQGLASEPVLPVVCESQKGRFEKIVTYYFPGDSAKLILGDKKATIAAILDPRPPWAHDNCWDSDSS